MFTYFQHFMLVTSGKPQWADLVFMSFNIIHKSDFHDFIDADDANH